MSHIKPYRTEIELRTRCCRPQVFCFPMRVTQDFADGFAVFGGDVIKPGRRVFAGHDFVKSPPDTGFHADRKSSERIGIDEEAARIAKHPRPEIVPVTYHPPQRSVNGLESSVRCVPRR